MSSNIYNYCTLDSDRNEIRLMELAPGRPGDDLSASLSTASLDEPLSYEALSYVWGDPAMPRSIMLGSSPFPTTKNLEIALRQMRLPTRPRILWVDAICINEENMEERQTQVQLMRRIYSQSTRVLIWLGEEGEGDEEVFDFLIRLSDGAHTFTRDCIDRPNDGYQKGDCQAPMRELKSLITRSWWFRAWTLQEIVCGKECQLSCGRLVISWQQLLQAYDRLKESSFTSLNEVEICSVCRSHAMAFTTKIGGIVAYRDGIEERRKDLLECVARHRTRCATDPRDKIYAFLGISATIHADLIVPTYAETVEKVYINFAFQILGQVLDGRRIFLHVADYERSQYQLPSWVPDWTSQKLTSYGELMAVTRQLRYSLYSACGSQATPIAFYEDISPGVLAFDGILVDKVVQIGELHPWEEWRPIYSVLKQWQDLAQLESDPDRPYVTNKSTFADAFWRTILCDTVIMGQFRGSQYIRAGPEHEEHFWKAWSPSELMSEIGHSHFDVANAKANGAPLWESPSAFQITASLPVAVLGRRFFITKTGFIGIGPPKIQEGDEIWVVATCKMPLVVRKSDTETIKFIEEDITSPLYTLVGESYVHGIMDGEKTSDWDQEKSLLMLQ